MSCFTDVLRNARSVPIYSIFHSSWPLAYNLSDISPRRSFKITFFVNLNGIFEEWSWNKRVEIIYTHFSPRKSDAWFITHSQTPWSAFERGQWRWKVLAPYSSQRWKNKDGTLCSESLEENKPEHTLIMKSSDFFTWS